MKKEVLYGLFIGAGVLFLLIPIFISFGITKQTSLLLYYAVPITGVLTGYTLSKVNSSSSLKEDKINENQEQQENQKALFMFIGQ